MGAFAGGCVGSLVATAQIAAHESAGYAVTGEVAHVVMTKYTAVGTLVGIAGSIDQEMEMEEKALKRNNFRQKND